MIRTVCLCGVVLAARAQVWAGIQVSVTNLVTDDQGVNPATITDTSLKNAWGISSNSTGPFWVSANGSGVANLYRVLPGSDAPTKQGLVVTIPGDGNVTGQVFNFSAAAGAFNSDLFLFVSEDGTISGWRGALGTTAETLAIADAANVYKGAAIGSIGGNSYLYAANFRAGTIDVLKGSGGAPSLSGTFVDPNLPSGYAPFNIQNLNNRLYVTYALQDGAKMDDVAGPGNGFVDVFDLNGSLLARVATQGTLNSPWGLALAPTSFGPLAGDLLVGNFGDGRINAFDLGTNSFVTQLEGVNGNPITIDGLWALSPGNGGFAGSPDEIYFSAGPNDEQNGLFGALKAVPEPSTLIIWSLLGTFAIVASWRQWRTAA
jgi:uncharacterized protein (TIGR03118 family)